MDTPALYHLMGAYFHEDWDLDGTEDEVVDAFLAGEPRFAPLLVSEIESVLDDVFHRTRARGTARHFGRLHTGPDPTSGGYRGFLTRIAATGTAYVRRWNLRSPFGIRSWA